MEDVEVVATVALSLVPGIGSRRLRQLVSTFGSAQAALDAPQSRLAATDGIGRGAATAIKAASAADGARVLETLAGLGARLLLPGDPEFPPQLAEIPDPPGERPKAGSFPRRNRLISGLSRAVVVIEAAAGSGAIVTADAGLEQSRPILAVPGPITSPTSVGCNKLIQQGATAALCAADILEEIGLPSGLAETGLALSTPAPRVPPIDLNGLQLALWTRMTAEPQHVDALVAAAQTGAASVLGALTELELRGLVRQGPGMVFGLT